MNGKHLTPVELEALALIAQGHDAKSAAALLNVSAQTIYERLRRAREKLGSNNSREAARLVFPQGPASDENLVNENFVLEDAGINRATHPLSDAAVTTASNSSSVIDGAYDASTYWKKVNAVLPLRGEDEKVIRVAKSERLRLIGDLSYRLALAFVAICLAAMVLSTLFRRG